jgi:hypothetical protein
MHRGVSDTLPQYGGRASRCHGRLRDGNLDVCRQETLAATLLCPARVCPARVAWGCWTLLLRMWSWLAARVAADLQIGDGAVVRGRLPHGERG